MTSTVTSLGIGRPAHNKDSDQVARRHQAIFDKFGQGASPEEIAAELDLSTNHIRKVLLDGGHQLSSHQGGGTDSIWDMDDNARRIAFARRAQRGARRALGMRDRLRKPVVAVVEAPDVVVPTIARVAKPTWSQIAAEVASVHRVAIRDLLGLSRERKVVVARHELMWRLRTEKQLSFPQIGSKLGRDHSTVIHGFKMHEKRLAAATKAGTRHG